MSAAEARQALAESDEAMRNGQEYAAERALQRAQVLATIAVAEEQRTANLIAAFERDAIQPPHESGAANKPFWNTLAVTITERLDLA
ncbi:hypothetical protein [Curtobacterium sp. DN_7.5]|uniref:hypothetical protein n=1 Tax=Curtobacterium sp. DN_7.5 TaxID=3049047 RepID=UPI001F58F98F|nr:hypothetical protein [Curtobacterium sp. DN_7.5]